MPDGYENRKVSSIEAVTKDRGSRDKGRNVGDCAMLEERQKLLPTR